MERKIPFRRGRLVQINYVLSSLPMFMLSFFEVPRGVLKKLNTIGQDSFGRMTGIKRNGSVGSMPLQLLEIGFHVEIHAIEWHNF